MKPPIEKLPIEELYKRWAVASVNASHYSKCLALDPESDKYAGLFSEWDMEEKLLITEIERRASLFPMPVLHNVINSCTPFSFRV